MSMPTKQEQLIAFQERLIRTGQWATCLNCEFYMVEAGNVGGVDLPADVCSKWAVQPPLKVIVVGCPEWIDRIPF